MPRKQLCAFGKEINHALVEFNQPKEWLIEQVGKQTGRYFDRSYLHKIQVGELSTPGIVQAIREILDLPENTGIDAKQKGVETETINKARERHGLKPLPCDEAGCTLIKLD